MDYMVLLGNPRIFHPTPQRNHSRFTEWWWSCGSLCFARFSLCYNCCLHIIHVFSLPANLLVCGFIWCI